MSYSEGFVDVEETGPTEIEWQGDPPPWLSGTLFRNGPGRYDRGQVKVNHWFDGLALLHSLHLEPSQVVYRSHFVRSHDYRTSQQSGTIGSPGFACDPCRSLFRKVMSAFVMDTTDNPNVSLVKQGEKFLALTELPIPMEFDPVTLQSIGPHVYQDRLGDGSTTAHPHQDGDIHFNQILEFGARTRYRLYSQEGLGPRVPFAEVPVAEASYLHSFGLSEDYLVLVCCPFQVKPLTLLFRNRPFIDNFGWMPRWGTRFHIVPRPGRAGQARLFKTDPFFCFHHVNSFQAEGHLLVDLVAYPDASIMESLRLPHLESGQAIKFGRLRRYRLDMKTSTITLERQSEHLLELPRIHYSGYNARTYRFVYGVSAKPAESVFYDRLIKLESETDRATYWHELGTFPGEPVFVPHPQGTEEDQGVLLSVVLCPERERSFLLVLGAQDMKERARAWLPLVPHGFHGIWQAGQDGSPVRKSRL